MKNYLLLVTILVLCSACQPLSNSTEPTSTELLLTVGNASFSEEELVEANNRFAIDLLRKQSAKEKDNNMFAGTFSIATVFAMLYAGSMGDTEKEIAKTFYWPENSSNFHETYANLLKNITQNTSTDYQFSWSNCIFLDAEFPVFQEFLNLNQNQYQSDLKALRFKAKNQAANIINKWSAIATDSMIPNIINPGNIEENTKIVLANAINFKAAWEYVFDREKTKLGKFTNKEKSTETELMYYYWQSSRAGFRDEELPENYSFSGAPFLYTENERLQVLKLPYKGEGDMLVFLPKGHHYKESRDSVHYELEDILKDFSLAEMDSLYHNMDTVTNKLLVLLPKFKTQFKLDCKSFLEETMPSAFSPNAELGRISKLPLVLHKVLHEASIEVNEEGTTATSVSLVEPKTVGSRNYATFFATHPFFYLIRDRKTGAILFAGQYVWPKEVNK